jgi:RNA polymerase sigma-70 factor (ECF subfamily)
VAQDPRAIGDAFVSGLANAGAAPGEARVAIGRAVELARDRARGEWPGVELDAVDFARYLGERARELGPPLEAVERLHTSDLFLACACSRGDRAAIDLFEQRIMIEVPLYLAKQRAEPAFVEEVQQEVRRRLFVAAEGESAAIASYGGRGPLGGWTRVVAVRTAAELRRAEQRGARRTSALAERVAESAVDPELDYLKARYAAELREAFETALASLAREERVLLRLHFVEGMTTHALGPVYGLDHSTIVRRLAKARGRLLELARARLGERLDISASHAQSLMLMARSRLDITLSPLFDESE